MSDEAPEFGELREKSAVRTGPTDEALAISVRNSGDTSAFEQLVIRYRARVTGLARKMLGAGHAEEAEDVAQEVFVAAYTHRTTFRPGSPFRPWLYRIAVNRCLDRLKSRARQPQYTSFENAPEPSVRDDREPLDMYLTGELEAALQKAVDALPLAYKAVFVLRHIDELSYEEIAAATSQPIGTVKTHLFRARAELRRGLSGYLHNDEGLGEPEQGGSKQ